MVKPGERVLIIEDDAATAELEKRALRRAGCDVEIATTLEEAMAQLEETLWDAVVLDFNLGSSPAWPVLECCTQKTPGIPVIMVTAMGDERLASEAISRGATDYVIKAGDFMQRLTQSVENTVRVTRAERALIRLKEWQSAILGSVNAHIALLDNTGTIIMVNEAWMRFAQDNDLADSKFCVNTNYLTVLENARGADAEYARKVERGLRDVLGGNVRRFSLEYPCHSPREPRWFRLDITSVREQQSQGAVVMHVDITERIRAEEAQLENAELLHNILQTVDEGILVVNSDGALHKWNRAAQTILGIDAAPLFRDWRTLLKPQDNPLGIDGDINDFPLVQALEGRVATDKELLVKPPGSRRLYLSVNARPLTDARGEVRGAVATFRDITERIARDLEIRRIAAAVEQTADAVLIAGTSGRIEYVNPALERLYGYRAGECLGRHISTLRHETEDSKAFAQLGNSMRAGKTWTGRLTIQTRSGEDRSMDATVTPVRNQAETVQFFVATGRDVTDQVVLDARMRQSQKLEAIGVLAGGIAHDFNNILAAIVGYTQMAANNLGDAQQASSDLDLVLRAAGRARDLVRQILTFSRQAEARFETVRADDILRESVDLMRATLPSTIQIQLKIDLEEAMVLGDETQIQQVIVNLCTNAAQAMRDSGGTLDLNLTRMDIEEGAPLTSTLQLRPGAYARLVVRDSGCGIPPEIVSKIFDPFFSTKKATGGTGLGLSTVLGIVQDHQGAINVSSVVGEGTEFEVYLPLSETLSATAKTPQSSGLQRGEGEHILIVDDEESLAILSGRMLENLGYRVTVFFDPKQALDEFRASPDIFDLVLSDFTMPGMTGDHLAREVHDIRADIPVVLLSGFTDNQDLEGSGLFRVLLKPVHLATLASTIREALDSRTVDTIA